MLCQVCGYWTPEAPRRVHEKGQVYLAYTCPKCGAQHLIRLPLVSRPNSVPEWDSKKK